MKLGLVDIDHNIIKEYIDESNLNIYNEVDLSSVDSLNLVASQDSRIYINQALIEFTNPPKSRILVITQLEGTKKRFLITPSSDKIVGSIYLVEGFDVIKYNINY